MSCVRSKPFCGCILQRASAAGRAGKSAVTDCLRRAKAAGLSDWAAIESLDEAALGARLYPGATQTAGRAPRVGLHPA